MGNALSSALRLLGITLYWIGLAPFVRWLTRRQPKVLLYHACLPEEDHFVRGLESNTTPAQLTMHLESLRGRYRIIPLSQLEAGAVPDHAVVITFDDGYRSVHDFAMPILRAHQAPATVYLISDVMDNASLVWVNELMWFLHVHADVTEPIVRRVLQRPSGESPAELVSHARATYDPAMIAALLGELRLAVGDGGAALAARASLYLDWSQVETMKANGFSFGNHTATHPNLARLTPDAQCSEVQTAQQEVTRHLGSCTSLAYPFGNHDANTREIALTLGHRSIMEVGGINAPLDVARVGRVPVQATTPAEFFAELEVATPIRGLLRRLLRG